MIHIPPQKLRDQLVKDNLITEEIFDKTKKEAERMGQDLAEILISRNIMRRNYYYNLLSDYFGTEMANLANKPISQEILKLIPEDIARERRVIVFHVDDGVARVAMEDPTDINTI